MKKLPVLLFTLLAAFALQAGAQDVAALKAELAEIKQRVATMEKLLGMSGAAETASKPAAAPAPAKPAGDTTTAAAGSAKVVGAIPDGMAPIPLELPKPMFKGTPVPAKGIPNLRKARGSARPAFIAPEGTKNVALNKEVTSSDDFPVIGELEMITDDDKDGSEGSYVELGPGLQWVQIDLEKEYELHAVVFWHFHAQARVYHDVILQVADDADFVKNVRTIFNNDYDNSSKLGIGKDTSYVETNEGELIPLKGEKARYLRMYSRGNTANEMNHYVEISVYGK